VTGAEGRAGSEWAKLGVAMAITSAESVVTSARMADLVKAQRAAQARHAAAKGLLTKAMKDGNAEKIAAARSREAAAYREAAHTGDQVITEMLTLNRAGLDNLGRVLDQMSRAWAADAEVTRGLAREAGPEPEAGP